jgi:enoyl-[acyl-carrier protein] reductase I
MTAVHTCQKLLDGRRGLILGVTRRNSAGFSCAEHFTKLGARLVVTSRPEKFAQGTELAAELSALPIAVEASDEETFFAAAERIDQEFGGLDFLVHTFVAAPLDALEGSVLDLSRDALSHVMDVSVRSLLVALRAMRPLLRRSASPRVVALTSSGADVAIQHYHAVGIAKAALNAAVRYTAAELGHEGILCNALSFSMVPTDTACRVIGAETTARTVSYLARRSMTGRAATLEDVASTAAFLVSEQCNSLTGQVLCVDSGFSASCF